MAVRSQFPHRLRPSAEARGVVELLLAIPRDDERPLRLQAAPDEAQLEGRQLLGLVDDDAVVLRRPRGSAAEAIDLEEDCIVLDVDGARVFARGALVDLAPVERLQ